MTSNNGYNMFGSGDCEKQPLPDGDVLQYTHVTPSEDKQVEVRWNWCHVVTSVFGYFCCQPFGLISLVMAMLAYSDHKVKDYTRSQHKRKVALGFGIAAIVIGSLLVATALTAFIVHMCYQPEYRVRIDDGGLVVPDRYGMDDGPVAVE